MAAQLMDGTATAKAMNSATASRAAAFEARVGRKACLATVLVGDDAASATYVRMKQRRSGRLGLESRAVRLPGSATTAQTVAAVRALDTDSLVDGILVQHPAPPQVDERAVFDAISPRKDVDEVTTTSLAAMALGQPSHRCCTPGGIVRLLDAYNVPIEGWHAVVVGRSQILGLPIGLLLLARNATVTYCHSHTRDLADQIAGADLVIAAVGRPELVKGAWIKPGAVVVDAGYNQGNTGDVEFDAAAQRASLITPVPGGVGPMTIATLLCQTIDAAETSS